MFKRVRYHASMGPGNLLFQLKSRVLGHRFRIAVAHAKEFVGHGLEIGGPSQIFGAHRGLGIYQAARRVDNVTYGTHTHWEGRLEAGETFQFDPRKAPGRQFIAEAGDLGAIADAKYDFVISSHMLEHSANPIRVLQEWKRVLKPDGVLLLVLPHKDGTFDRLRPVTPLAHLIEDAHRQVDEHDTTHLDEILRLHDFARDPEHDTQEELRAWIEDNFRNRGAHQHVFDARSAAQLMDHLRWQIRAVELVRPHHICLLVQKIDPARSPDNSAFLAPGAQYLRASPFPSDRAMHRAMPASPAA